MNSCFSCSIAETAEIAEAAEAVETDNIADTAGNWGRCYIGNFDMCICDSLVSQSVGSQCIYMCTWNLSVTVQSTKASLNN